MPRRSSAARRSAVDWTFRGSLAVVATVIGYVSVTHSLAQVIEVRDPARAHALTPWDGRIAARLAERRFVENATGGVRAPVEHLARMALRRNPTAVSAVATLGLQAQLRGDTARARRLFAYAQSLSRRDLRTHLWWIEDAVARGDVPGALRHYDVALRTSKVAPDLLFPVLASAIADPTVQANLVLTLAKRPAWAPNFINYVSSAGADPRSIAGLFAGSRRVGVPISTEAMATVINGLIAVSAFDEAWRHYASVRGDVDRRASRDPQFTANLSTPSLLDWTPINDASVATSIQRGENSGIFDFSVPPSAGGTLLQQLQMLPLGSYRLEGHSIGIEQPERSLPYWALTCRDGRELGRVVVSNSVQANGIFAGRLSVPSGCPVQTLSLVARPSDEISGVTGQIDRVQLFPVE